MRGHGHGDRYVLNACADKFAVHKPDIEPISKPVIEPDNEPVAESVIEPFAIAERVAQRESKRIALDVSDNEPQRQPECFSDDQSQHVTNAGSQWKPIHEPFNEPDDNAGILRGGAGGIMFSSVRVPRR